MLVSLPYSIDRYISLLCVLSVTPYLWLPPGPKSTITACLLGTHPILQRAGGRVGLGGWLCIETVYPQMVLFWPTLISLPLGANLVPLPLGQAQH